MEDERDIWYVTSEEIQCPDCPCVATLRKFYDKHRDIIYSEIYCFCGAKKIKNDDKRPSL